jgi:hypothetical protein
MHGKLCGKLLRDWLLNRRAPDASVGGSVGRAFKGDLVGGFPPRGAPLFAVTI